MLNFDKKNRQKCQKMPETAEKCQNINFKHKLTFYHESVENVLSKNVQHDHL